MKAPQVEIEITGLALPRTGRADLRAFAAECVQAAEKRRAAPFRATQVSVAIVDDREMKRLNRRFRGKSRTTDVLTFPADPSYREPGAHGRPLGDIVISIDQARRQAREEGHSLAIEIRYLLLHGILHAYGYDHETDEGEMNALEMRMRRAVGLE